jgi:hypothetical protein
MVARRIPGMGFEDGHHAGGTEARRNPTTASRESSSMASSLPLNAHQRLDCWSSGPATLSIHSYNVQVSRPLQLSPAAIPSASSIPPHTGKRTDASPVRWRRSRARAIGLQFLHRQNRTAASSDPLPSPHQQRRRRASSQGCSVELHLVLLLPHTGKRTDAAPPARQRIGS